MKVLDAILSRLGFLLLACVSLAAPWFFGAWEMWWFWLFAVLIFAAACVFALRVLIDPRMVSRGLSLLPLLLAYAVFLVYAFIRFRQADVYMDAERSFLLHLTPFLIGLQIVYGLRSGQRRILFMLLAANFVLLGLYGIINHLAAGSERVLWMEGYPQYVKDDRATGSYYCPDHFAGIMELGFCLALPLLVDLRSGKWWRLGGLLLAGLAVVGVVLSKSRGGGLTILAIGTAFVVWGFSQWPVMARGYLRWAAIMAAVALLVPLGASNSAYVVRFKAYFMPRDTRGLSLAERRDRAVEKVMADVRPRMIAAALRAWRTAPAFGIGPGMHQNLWPNMAATPDGDRERGVWPTYTNRDFHSYEVHSDWVQLLEEYGYVGLGLFLLSAALVFRRLVAGLPRAGGESRSNGGRAPLHAAPLTALLAFVCMAFHSLGDFNLQMPATVWVFAVLIALPFGEPSSIDIHPSVIP